MGDCKTTFLVLTTASLAALILSASCRPKTEPTATVSDEIRGEPIVAPATNTDPLPDGADRPLQIRSGDEVLSTRNGSTRPTASTNAPTLYPKGVTPVGFDKLGSFEYVMPETRLLPGADPDHPPGRSQIPPEIQALDRTRVALKGFMLPLKLNAQKGIVTEMLIMKDQSMCCYGTTPKINEWVNVRLSEERGVKAVIDEAVTIFGRLRVGEVRENGYLVGIYEMEGEGMIASP